MKGHDGGESPERTRPDPRAARASHGAPVTLAEGASFGRFRLVRKLGSGGCAEVWEAEEESGRRVALKVVTETADLSAEALARFEQEGRLAASLSHPRCVYVYGAEQAEGAPVIVMELMQGGSLQELIEREGRLRPDRAVSLILDVVDGLEAAQGAGIVHRDVKPSNCFLDAAGRVRVGDFGISKSLESSVSLTATSTFIGTPAYSSPEQVRGRPVDFRTDVYATGATLHALLTGRPPFEATSPGDLLVSIAAEKPAPLRRHGVRVRRGLERVLFRMLEKAPEDRPQSWAELRAALAPFAPRRVVPASRASRALAHVLDIEVTVLLLIVLATIFALAAPSVTRSWRIPVYATADIGLLALLEATLGGSLGKYLAGLRVRDAGGGRLGSRKAIVRALAFSGPCWLLLGLRLPEWGLAWMVVRLVTMRERNGWAGIHDLVSRSRVMSLSPRTGTARGDFARHAVADGKSQPAITGESVGPYEIAGITWQRGDESLLRAWDPALRRPVWLRRGPASAACARIERPGRLHWLRSGPDGSWSAYELPGGASLRDRVRASGALGWASARPWIEQLLTEVAAALDSGDLPDDVSLDHVWIDAHGRVRLLEFPVVARDAEAAPASESPWRTLLQRATLLMMEGRDIAPEALRAPRPPTASFPEHARPALERILAHDLDARELAGIASDLRAQAERPARFPAAARRRFIAYAMLAPVAMGLLGAGSAMGRGASGPVTLVIGMVGSLLITMIFGIASVLGALMLGSGPTLRGAGVAVQASSGGPASRRRCALRAAVAWAPSLAALVVLVVTGFLGSFVEGVRRPRDAGAQQSYETGYRRGRAASTWLWGPRRDGATSGNEVSQQPAMPVAKATPIPVIKNESDARDGTIVALTFGVLLALQLASGIHALVRPDRMIADRIARTRLVPN